MARGCALEVSGTLLLVGFNSLPQEQLADLGHTSCLGIPYFFESPLYRTKEQERDVRFVELGEYLCEVRARQYWRLENLKSFDEFLEKRFADSRRKAYYLMAIHETLTRIPKHDLQQVGWSKATELVKVARRDGEEFDCATWLHKAKEMPKEDFKCAVERHLTGKATEPWEIIHFKLYKSQLPVVEKALETAGLMLGTDKSRGYCLEMICADFLAGANFLENAD